MMAMAANRRVASLPARRVTLHGQCATILMMSGCVDQFLEFVREYDTRSKLWRSSIILFTRIFCDLIY